MTWHAEVYDTYALETDFRHQRTGESVKAFIKRIYDEARIIIIRRMYLTK